jgi:hypothetical protein
MGRLRRIITEPTADVPVPSSVGEFDDDRYVSLYLASHIAGISRTSLYREINAGRLISRKVAGRSLVKLASLRLMLEDAPPVVYHDRPRKRAP